MNKPLVLALTDRMYAQAAADANEVQKGYATRAKSVYTFNWNGTHNSMLAEIALAQYYGADRADPRKPWLKPYDVAPNWEVRHVRHPENRGAPRVHNPPGGPWVPAKPVTQNYAESWARFCLTLYEKDALDRRYVLASLSGRTMRYYGWQLGENLWHPPVTLEDQKGREYQVCGTGWPDELEPMPRHTPVPIEGIDR